MSLKFVYSKDSSHTNKAPMQGEVSIGNSLRDAYSHLPKSASSPSPKKKGAQTMSSIFGAGAVAPLLSHVLRST